MSADLRRELVANVLIGYDLNRPGQDYKDLIDSIEALGTWWHCLDSTWIVITNKTPVQVRDILVRHLDKNDTLFVVDITGKPAAWTGFTGNCASWLKRNL